MLCHALWCQLMNDLHYSFLKEDMLHTRKILRKNRQGNVVKVIREHYLRDDIYCGSLNCQKCYQPENAVLSDSPRNGVYLCIDSSVALNQMDILEYAKVQDVIVFSSVLDEVRESNLPLYNRLRSAISRQDKRFYVFSNEFHHQTYVERNSGESMAKRNERAALKAAAWYLDHLRGLGIDIALLTDDEALKNRAQELGITAMSVNDYAESVKDDIPELLDMVALNVSGEDGGSSGDAKFHYDEHLSVAKLSAGLKQGLFFQGKLNVSNHNPFEGSVFATINGEEKTVNLSGRKALSRAVHDDIVVFELLPKSEWKKLETSAIIDEDGADEGDLVENNSMEVEKQEDKLEIGPNDIPYGKIVGILKRNWRPYCGVIDSQKIKSSHQQSKQTSCWFYPIDKKIPKIRIRTRQAERFVNKRIMVALDSWPKDSMFPLGHFVKVVGYAGNKETEVEVLLLEHEIPHEGFSKQIQSELPVEGENWVVKEQDFVGREDFRNLKVCSIDPPGCTDIDDALHCRTLPNGNFECGVHIADVTHFVKPDTEMDKEGAKRGTTVYLVDKRIDMLPMLLGSNLCSLRENVDRLAFSVIWELDSNAKIVNTRFCKSVIRSCASLTYAEAQAKIDNKGLNDELTTSIRNLNKLAKIMRQERRERGSIVLSSPEVRFKLEHDSQDPVDLELKELKETNALVEEFMLLANISVAKEIFRKFPEVAVLRRHPKPETSNFERLNVLLKPYNIKLMTQTSKQMADSLDEAKTPNDSYFNNLVRVLATRCMFQAKYFCSGNFTYDAFWHYGLATEIYTHFTSPIRRYADILVHRLLHACIDETQIAKTPSLFDRAKIRDICENINHRHHMAQKASRSSVELYTNLFFRGKVVEEEGYILRTMRNGFSVLIPK